MRIGMIYSCKWSHGHGRRTYQGWDMLLFLGMKDNEYLFYDIVSSTKCMLGKGLIRHCKEINLEEV